MVINLIVLDSNINIFIDICIWCYIIGHYNKTLKNKWFLDLHFYKWINNIIISLIPDK